MQKFPGLNVALLSHPNVQNLMLWHGRATLLCLDYEVAKNLVDRIGPYLAEIEDLISRILFHEQDPSVLPEATLPREAKSHIPTQSTLFEVPMDDILGLLSLTQVVLDQYNFFMETEQGPLETRYFLSGAFVDFENHLLKALKNSDNPGVGKGFLNSYYWVQDMFFTWYNNWFTPVANGFFKK